MNKPAYFLAVAVGAVFSTASLADVFFVDDDVCPDPGGGTEADPFCAIQDAIDAAVDTDEIIVAPGAYFETINFLGKAVTLRSSDGPGVTTIDAQGSGTVVTCNTGEGPGTVLDGFVITGGDSPFGGGLLNLFSSPTVTNCTFLGNSESGMRNIGGFGPANPTVTNCTFLGNVSGADGGGMFNDASSPAVTDCTFLGNSATGDGGGMYNTGGSNPTVTNCTFSSNSAFDNGGAGMYNGNDSNPTVISCTFDGNSAGDHGGGGMYNSFSSPTVINCTFSSNFGGLVNGGGGMLNNSSDPTVSNCTFSGNVALFTGGGMYSLNSNPTVTDCAFSDNFAIDGSGMYNFLSSPTVTDCRFSGNIAGGDGGGIYSSAGDPIVTNCTFSGNTSGSLGGGMANIGGSPTVANCTFIDNVAVFNGGGMFNIINSPTVTNCILWGNSPEEISGGTPTVTYSDVQGGFPGTGNIDADPLFVDPANSDLRLSPDSPCIDAADNTTPDLAGITTDLDGNPRFLDVPETPDTGNGELPIVDMGAYEALGGGCLAVTSQDIVCHADGSTFTVNIEGLNACTGGTTMVSFTGSGGAAGEEACFTVLVSDGGFCCSTEICVTVPDCSPDCDVNGDGVVGILDYLALLDTWGVCSDCGTPTSCPADFNHDCEVSSTDFLILLANWG